MGVERPSISAVICTRDRPTYLKKCLSSLINQTYKPKEIIVVDDASEKEIDIMSWVKNEVSVKNSEKVINKKIDIILIRNRKKQGVVKSRNIGISAAKGDIIAFIDDDGYARRNWVKNLVKNYSSGIVGVGGPVIEIGRKFEKRYFKRMSYITPYGDIRHCYRVGKLNEVKYLQKKPVRFLMGGNMSFRKDLLLKVGGFDYRFKGNHYREETDLCLRVSKLGKIIFEPSASVYHDTARHGGTRDIIKFHDFIYWYFRNTAMLFLQHFSFQNAFKKIYLQFKTHKQNIKESEKFINRDYLIKSSPIKSMIAIFKGIFFGSLFGILFNFIPKQMVYKNPQYVFIITIVFAGATFHINMLENVIETIATMQRIKHGI